MERRQPPSRVRLNPVAVSRLVDELNMSQNELARRCGITPGHHSLLMNGKRSPSPKLRRRMQQVLGVNNFDDLFVIVPVEVGDGRSEQANGPERKKGNIHGDREGRR